MRTYCSKATHAILGSHPELGNGILCWHDNEFDAHRDCKNLNNAPNASCRVIKTPAGDMAKYQDEILGLIL